jgi:PleD family two-component response regulator
MILLGRTVKPIAHCVAAAHFCRLQYEAAVLSLRDVPFAEGGSIMAHRIYVDSIDDFIMWRAIDAIKPGSIPRVLVVDDYPVGTDALQLLLEQNGFEARTVSDARPACVVVDEWLSFAIVLDLVMPRNEGV